MKNKYAGTWQTNSGNTYGHTIRSNNKKILMSELKAIVKGNIASNTDKWAYSIYDNVDYPFDAQPIIRRFGQGYM